MKNNSEVVQLDPSSVLVFRIKEHQHSQQIPLDTCYFGNCIIDGNGGNELELDMIGTATTYSINHKFSYCYLRTNVNTSDPLHFVTGTNRINGVTSFGDPATYNFTLGGLSAAVGMGGGAMTDANKFPFDIINTDRVSLGNPDAGAYEK